jgi:hypothetical protein
VVRIRRRKIYQKELSVNSRKLVVLFCFYFYDYFARREIDGFKNLLAILSFVDLEAIPETSRNA